MAKDENNGLLSKVVKFVRNPTTNWADLDQQETDRESTYSKQMLKEMIERKRRNDFVRKREFDMLRKMRRSEVMAGQDPAARPSFFQSSMPSKPDDRAMTLKKIDEIEAQMSMQWWKTKHPAHHQFPRCNLPGGHHQHPPGSARQLQTLYPHRALAVAHRQGACHCAAARTGADDAAVCVCHTRAAGARQGGPRCADAPARAVAGPPCASAPARHDACARGWLNGHSRCAGRALRGGRYHRLFGVQAVCP
jgi:hypothetical protein